MKIIKVPYRLECNAVLKELPHIASENGFLQKAAVEETDIWNIGDILAKENEKNGKAVILGGTHAVTYNCLKNLKDKNFGIIIFDAHPDCDPSFREIVDEKHGMKDGKTQRDLLIELIENKNSIVPKERIILVGVRSIKPAEREFLKLHNIRHFTMKHIFDIGIKEVCDAVMETARQWPNLYVSVDIDCIDPAFAPGTACIEPGGLSAREIIYFLQRLRMLNNLKFVDICEFDEKKDIDRMTAKLAAKMIREVAGGINAF